MAANATILKAELQVTDLDRHYYASHALTLAQHPSETDARLLVRLLAFALHADERLEFGRGLSDEDEPALWRRDYTGAIEQWIELGQPDETRLRKASARTQHWWWSVTAVRPPDAWWKRNGRRAGRGLRNLSVLESRRRRGCRRHRTAGPRDAGHRDDPGRRAAADGCRTQHHLASALAHARWRGCAA